MSQMAKVKTLHMIPVRGMRQEGLRTWVIGLIGFLTLVDLFAAQAILPSLVETYQVTPAAMGFAVNASTMGMAIASLVVGLISRYLNRRRGIWISLALLAVPTALLAGAPDLTIFTALRIIQGVFMASAFTLTMAYLAEHCSIRATASALAGYITGVVASNLIGRFVSAGIADTLGLSANFFAFALLNLAGAAVVVASLSRVDPVMIGDPAARPQLTAWAVHLRDPAMRAAFAIGFLILFAFIGTFTYVNFVLVRVPISLSAMSLGFVYFVFLPSMFTTPVAGRFVERFGTKTAFLGGVLVAVIGLPLLLVHHLPIVLAGMMLVAVGTFFAQAIATGFVSRTAVTDRPAASGLYLSAYYLGGLAGAALLGQIFDRFGWAACVFVIAIALLLAGLLASHLRVGTSPSTGVPSSH